MTYCCCPARQSLSCRRGGTKCPPSRTCTLGPKRAETITKDSTYPAHTLFNFLPSGRRYRSLHTKTTRHKNNYFPTAVTLLNCR
ncbi:hypothetical protein AALO_G00045360 [Alosa alosa]|uniref:Uncharacterized protein n=1 Tax=Alosa alosa TaxID=278164 RepID=A0AAV6H965_9TELE|nr:hypothetical protein AALO_G00045360 [Alosa alosa]